MKLALLGIVLSFSVLGFSQELTSEQKSLEFNQLVGQIYSSYGPLEYKQKVQNIDIKAITAQYKTLIENSKNNAEYYDLLQKYVASFRDSHFAVRVPSKRRAKLPLGVDLVEGKVLISEVDTKALPADKYPIKRGDEIVQFGGRPVMEVVQELVPFRGDGYSKTSLRLAVMFLTSRSAGVFNLPQGNVTVEIKSRETKNLASYELTWALSGNDWETMISFSLRKFWLDDLSVFSLLRKDLGPRFERSYMCNGGSRIKRPEGATVITENDFVAYYYPTAKGHVGYLRIPHYMPAGFPNLRTEDAALAQYEYAINELEKNTVGLIIDQDHNCGGSVSFLQKLAGMFLLQPAEPTPFRIQANKEFLIALEAEMEKMNQHTLEYKSYQEIFELVKTSRKAGEYLTPKTYFTVDPYLYPNKVRYTKPVMILIDELSGSGGDAFPALLQGVGRAQLLGTRTMGAGGHVTQMPSLAFSRVDVYMTRSLFYRPDGVEVENNGAVPNIPYNITEEDFVNEYVPYREFYTKKLLEML